MTNKQNTTLLPVSQTTLESSARVMEELGNGRFEEQYLTNTALPFADKQAAYLSSYDRSICSRNHRYILECRGEEE